MDTSCKYIDSCGLDFCSMESECPFYRKKKKTGTTISDFEIEENLRKFEEWHLEEYGYPLERINKE